MVLDDPGRPTPGPPSSSPRRPVARVGSLVWQIVVRAGTVLVPGGLVAVALLGAVATSLPAMLGLAPLLGLFAAGVVLTVSPASPASPARPQVRRTALLAGAGGALMVPFSTGVGMLGGARFPVVMTLLLLTSCVTADRLSRLDDVLAGQADGGPGDGPGDRLGDGPGDRLGDVEAIRELLPTLPTGELLAAWRRTGPALRAAPSARARAVRVRDLLVEELTRRDPGGVARWLASGDDSPEGHVRSDFPG